MLAAIHMTTRFKGHTGIQPRRYTTVDSIRACEMSGTETISNPAECLTPSKVCCWTSRALSRLHQLFCPVSFQLQNSRWCQHDLLGWHHENFEVQHWTVFATLSSSQNETGLFSSSALPNGIQLPFAWVTSTSCNSQRN